MRGPCDSKQNLIFSVVFFFCHRIVSLFIFFYLEFSIVVMFFLLLRFYFPKANIFLYIFFLLCSLFENLVGFSSLWCSFILTHSLYFHPVSFLYLCFIVIFVMWMHQFFRLCCFVRITIVWKRHYGLYLSTR